MTEQYSFPTGWIEQLKPLLGGHLPDFLHSYKEASRRGLRTRPGRRPPQDVIGPIPWAENAWEIPLSSPDGALPAHDAGAYYLQEPSAMAPAAALHPLPGEKVLDLCAAPGGKSTQLAASMEGKGLIICNEPVPSRAQILSRNIERMGIRCAAVVSALPEELSARWPGFFDKVLVDAPCSGEGMFRRHPESRLAWNESAPAGCAQRQERILLHAADMLRPGGTLAYSTCTFNEPENEGVIARFLSLRPDFHLLPFALPGLPSCNGTLRLWPHEIAGEGHFAALLRREETNDERPSVRPCVSFPAPEKAKAALAERFLSETLLDAPRPNALFAGRLVCAPEGLPPLQGVRVLRLGLHLGEIRGRLFFPDHAAALACAPVSPVPVTEEMAFAYQRGETLDAPASCRGFVVPALDGLSLGWAKASDGQLKNHYPKGLRRVLNAGLNERKEEHDDP